MDILTRLITWSWLERVFENWSDTTVDGCWSIGFLKEGSAYLYSSRRGSRISKEAKAREKVGEGCYSVSMWPSNTEWHCRMENKKTGEHYSHGSTKGLAKWRRRYQSKKRLCLSGSSKQTHHLHQKRQEHAAKVKNAGQTLWGGNFRSKLPYAFSCPCATAA